MRNNKHHGGDLGWAKNHFGTVSHEWIDLSTGINQTPYPFEINKNLNINSLPSQMIYEECLKAAGRYYKASLDTDNTLLTPGSQFIIGQLPHLFAPDEVTILYPTYGEHAPAWQEAGHKVHLVSDLDEAKSKNTGFILLVNPNNPDGTLYSKDKLKSLLEYQAARGGYLVIDEAFIDVSPEESLSTYTGHDGLIILRSFGKFFGLAGIRLGSLLAPTNVIQKLQRRLGPWAVSSITLEIAKQAYQDEVWISNQIDELTESGDKLDFIFQQAGCKAIGGTILYRLYEHDQATALFQHMGQNGIYLRHFEYNQNWLRVGVPNLANKSLWDRVGKAIDSFHC